MSVLLAALLTVLIVAVLFAGLTAMGRRMGADRRSVARTPLAEATRDTPAASSDRPPGEPPSQARLVDALHEAVISTSRDARILTWNLAAERIYGYAPAEVLGRPVHEVLQTQLASGAALETLDAEIDRAGQARHEVRQRRRDGMELTLEAHVVAIRDAGGALAGHVYVARDVSEQKSAEAAVRRSEAKFRAAFQGAGIAIALLDDRGAILEYNRAFREMLGYSDAELKDRTIATLLHPDDADRARADFSSALAGHTDVVTGERRYIRKDGGIVQGVLRSTVIRDESGKFLYSVGLIEDVTEKRAVEAQLVFADRMASMGTLAAGVAHEINNPLSFILANLNYVAEELGHAAGVPEDVLRAIEETREGAIRVREIVRDLKMFSRADDRSSEGTVDVRTVLQSALNLTQNEIRHRARLTVELGDAPAVHGSAHRLGQVFVNLLINATQAIADPVPDRNAIRVRCATREDGQAVVEVSDTGRGIAPENLARIFEPFFTTKPVGVGTGLGLSICHGIVTRLGGRIEVESELGRGTTFRVCLPPAGDASGAGATTASAAATTPVPRARILVVDDEPMVGNAVARTLSPDHDLTVVSSARAALELVSRNDGVDAIVCDLLMPEMTGMDLYDALGSDHAALRDRMVFLTGGAFTATAQAFLSRVSNPRLEKPFEAAALRGLVRQVLSAPR